MTDENPYAPPAARVGDPVPNVPEKIPRKNLEGLGGWLILVGLGIVISPLRMISVLVPLYHEMFSTGSFETLTTPGTEAYHPLWAPVVYGEITLNVAIGLAWVFIAILFFSRKKAFPKWYIGTVIFSLVFVISDVLVVKYLLPNESVLDPDTIKEFTRSLATCLIWVPYMLVSKRVKATFIR